MPKITIDGSVVVAEPTIADIPTYEIEATISELRDPGTYDKWIKVYRNWFGIEHEFWANSTERMVELYNASGLAVDDTVLLNFVDRDKTRRVVTGKLHGSFS